MIERKDVERLADAYAKVQAALEKNNPRKAATILCKEFNWLLDEKGSFWAGVADATEQLNVYRDKEREILNNVTKLIDEEAAIFARLKIKRSLTEPIIGIVYGRLRLAEGIGGDLSRDSLGALREQLREAAKLICKQSKGRLRRSLDWVLSWKGATVLAGATIVGANVAVMILAQNHAISLVSVKAGMKVMQGDLAGIIDLFGGHGGA
jgi:hypothetical protein